MPPSRQMPFDPRPNEVGQGRRGALFGYLILWLAGAAAVVAILVAALDGDGPETVALPPVRQIDLVAAADKAGCELRRVRRGEVTNPPVTGPAATPATPGVKPEAPSTASLTAALRRGILVIQFGQGLSDARIDELRRMQKAVPDGTIVTPNATGMRYRVAATAYRRLLGCPSFTDATLDALRLFRGRFIGSGPDG